MYPVCKWNILAGIRPKKVPIINFTILISTIGEAIFTKKFGNTGVTL